MTRQRRPTPVQNDLTDSIGPELDRIVALIRAHRHPRALGIVQARAAGERAFRAGRGDRGQS